MSHSCIPVRMYPSAQHELTISVCLVVMRTRSSVVAPVRNLGRRLVVGGRTCALMLGGGVVLTACCAAERVRATAGLASDRSAVCGGDEKCHRGKITADALRRAARLGGGKRPPGVQHDQKQIRGIVPPTSPSSRASATTLKASRSLLVQSPHDNTHHVHRAHRCHEAHQGRRTQGGTEHDHPA
jgi:hypothetical protein